MKANFENDELVYNGLVADVHRVQVRMPDGNLVDRDFFRYAGAAVILPVLDDGSIVLIRNYRFAVDEHLYELPAGILEKDEDPIKCALRELIEETGYTAGRIEAMGMFYTGPGTSDEQMHAFVATELSDGAQQLEKYEQISVEVHPDEQVRRMVRDGTIHDAKTIAVLGIYWLGDGER